MGIKDVIQANIKEAMKARDQRKLNVLRSVHAAIKQVEIDTRKELEDGDVGAIIQKELKKRRESLEFAEKAARQDLIDENKYEIELLLSYLGQQLSEGELRTMIAQLKGEGCDTMGKIMASLNQNHRGQFDGKLASNIAKELLA